MEKRYCIFCGAEIATEAPFCISCGKRQTEEKPLPPPPPPQQGSWQIQPTQEINRIDSGEKILDTVQVRGNDLFITSRRLIVANMSGDSANVASFEYGINDAIPHSRGGELLCPGNNIAEGFERDSDADFKRFLYYAKGSCGEVRSMIYIACDLHLIDDKMKDKLLAKCILISSGIANFIKYLKT